MTGSALIALLEQHGFSIVRRAKSYVWVGRGNDVLLVDEEAELEDEVVNALLEQARRLP